MKTGKVGGFLVTSLWLVQVAVCITGGEPYPGYPLEQNPDQGGQLTQQQFAYDYQYYDDTQYDTVGSEAAAVSSADAGKQGGADDDQQRSAERADFERFLDSGDKPMEIYSAAAPDSETETEVDFGVGEHASSDQYYSDVDDLGEAADTGDDFVDPDGGSPTDFSNDAGLADEGGRTSMASTVHGSGGPSSDSGSGGVAGESAMEASMHGCMQSMDNTKNRHRISGNAMMSMCKMYQQWGQSMRSGSGWTPTNTQMNWWQSLGMKPREIPTDQPTPYQYQPPPPPPARDLSANYFNGQATPNWALGTQNAPVARHQGPAEISERSGGGNLLQYSSATANNPRADMHRPIQPKRSRGPSQRRSPSEPGRSRGYSRSSTSEKTKSRATPSRSRGPKSRRANNAIRSRASSARSRGNVYGSRDAYNQAQGARQETRTGSRRRSRRVRRQTTQDSGRALRKEYRMLSESERERFHTAVNALKQTSLDGLSKYDLIVRLHHADMAPGAHFGPGFLGYHREYLLRFENALREVDPGVSLPYWDSNMDYHLDDDELAKDSMMWSDRMLGNGDGYVTSGPFANWPLATPSLGTTQLHRNLTVALPDSITKPNLMSDMSLKFIRGAQSLRELTWFADVTFESSHGATHNWVGGVMADLPNSPNDPVFFMHHAFVDCLWEEMRNRQRAGFPPLDPRYDYPNDTEALGVGVIQPDGTPLSSPRDSHHYALNTVLPFAPMRNIDALREEYFAYYYSCSPRPTCSQDRPTCESPYLFCNRRRFHCVPKLQIGARCAAFSDQDPCFEGTCCRGTCSLTCGPKGDAAKQANTLGAEGSNRSSRGNTRQGNPADDGDVLTDDENEADGRGATRRDAVTPETSRRGRGPVGRSRPPGGGRENDRAGQGFDYDHTDGQQIGANPYDANLQQRPPFSPGANGIVVKNERGIPTVYRVRNPEGLQPYLRQLEQTAFPVQPHNQGANNNIPQNLQPFLRQLEGQRAFPLQPRQGTTNNSPENIFGSENRVKPSYVQMKNFPSLLNPSQNVAQSASSYGYGQVQQNGQSAIVGVANAPQYGTPSGGQNAGAQTQNYRFPQAQYEAPSAYAAVVQTNSQTAAAGRSNPSYSSTNGVPSTHLNVGKNIQFDNPNLQDYAAPYNVANLAQPAGGGVASLPQLNIYMGNQNRYHVGQPTNTNTGVSQAQKYGTPVVTSGSSPKTNPYMRRAKQANNPGQSYSLGTFPQIPYIPSTKSSIKDHVPSADVANGYTAAAPGFPPFYRVAKQPANTRQRKASIPQLGAISTSS